MQYYPGQTFSNIHDYVEKTQMTNIISLSKVTLNPDKSINLFTLSH